MAALVVDSRAWKFWAMRARPIFSDTRRFSHVDMVRGFVRRVPLQTLLVCDGARRRINPF